MTIPAKFFIAIDILIALIYIVFIYNSYKNGMLFEGISLFYTLISLAVAYFVSPILARRFEIFSFDSELYSLFDLGYYLHLIAWFVIVFLLLKLAYFLIAPVLKSISKVPVLGFVNRLGGVVFGVFNATVVVMLLSLLTLTPLFDNGKAIREGTAFKYVNSFTTSVTKYISEKIRENGVDVSDGISIEDARTSFENWLISQGILHE